MKKLIRPPRLKRGDRVATVSLSSGIAGDADFRARYECGKRRLQEQFGLEVVEMAHTLAGSDFLYAHPEARAADLMAAFADPAIKGIISCTGGDDSIRLHSYIDYEVIRQNPKLYSGFSDSTITHLMCWKAGLASQYGPSVLSDFAENVKMPDYTVEWIEKMWFAAEAPGEIPPSPTVTAQYLEWTEENAGTARDFEPNTGYELVQGRGVARGPLFGGCLEIIDLVRGTGLLPPARELDGAVWFLETSEERPPVWFFTDALRALAAMGLLGTAAGLLLGRPQDGDKQAEYHAEVRRVLAECGREDMPVLGNCSFGHNEPRHPLPYGAAAEIDCTAGSLSILEAGIG